MHRGEVQDRRIDETRHHEQPILAIDLGGSITRANAPARRLFRLEEKGNDQVELGEMLASVMLARRDGLRRALVSLVSAEGQRSDVLLVVSGEEVNVAEPPAIPVAESSNRQAPIIDFIAHELRNPIGTIAGLSHILESRSGSIGRDDLSAALETIQSEADRALIILEALLRLAEARSQASLSTESVPLHALLWRVIKRHQRSHPHRYVVCSGDSPVFAQANPLWVELAVSNLLSNAEKYTPKDQEIEVSLHQTGSSSSIAILDQGRGLRPELYRSLWQIYSQGPERGVEVSGSGIGLALCKELVEGMGGHVWAGPRSSGGSAFTMSLPGPWDMVVPADCEGEIDQVAGYPAFRESRWG